MEILLIQRPGVPNRCQISAGGHAAVGYYCAFHGDRDHAIECLRQVLKALEEPTHAVKVESDHDPL